MMFLRGHASLLKHTRLMSTPLHEWELKKKWPDHFVDYMFVCVVFSKF